MPGDEYQKAIQRCAAHASKLTNCLLIVSIPRQTLTVYRDGAPTRSFIISTSSRPPSCIQDSLGTPDGLHKVAEKYGDGAPLGTVFKGRVSTGNHYSAMPPEEQARNLVTSRILRLRGLEAGHNAGSGCDSFDRYIYIHGSNHEDRLGQPQSAGCVLMNNTEIASLYDEVPIGTLVDIQL